MSQIIELTDAALAHIKQMMAKQIDSIGFRLSIKKTGCSGYAYVPAIIEKVTESDIHFVAREQLNVYIDSASESFLKDVIVDYVADSMEGLKQKRLVFNNPNEKNRCGCGESFTIE
jgi:iron-sulfur cluster assembly accessory protein